jgi:DNA helicase-2/ATP-dependent DNA helicase PcrA
VDLKEYITQKFREAYARLNEAQKIAVDTVEGPVMVVAGPGTGKTQILTLRIANILRKTDAEPSSILALTFTESGVASMRRRLAEMIGGPAYAVNINTFHGFCNEIIKNYPEVFPRIIGSQNITEVDQIRIIQELILDLPLRELKPFGDAFFYLRPILSSINELKREGVTPEKFEALMEKEEQEFRAAPDLFHEKGPHAGKMKGEYQKILKSIGKNRELASVYTAYRDELGKRKLYDYSDMIMEAVQALGGNENLLLILQEQYQYILVDEHQDTNSAQNKILELLCNFHANPNIFVVGDEKQAIFRFQGASLENFLYFKRLYPGAKFIALEENYRSTQAILDCAHSLIAGEKRLRANIPHPGSKITAFALSSPEVENYFLARHIKGKIEEGIVPGEIAVLCRDNRDAFPIARAFDKAGVEYSLESDQNVLSDNGIRKFISILAAVNGFGSQESFIEAMHVDFVTATCPLISNDAMVLSFLQTPKSCVFWGRL